MILSWAVIEIRRRSHALFDENLQATGNTLYMQHGIWPVSSGNCFWIYQNTATLVCLLFLLCFILDKKKPIECLQLFCFFSLHVLPLWPQTTKRTWDSVMRVWNLTKKIINASACQLLHYKVGVLSGKLHRKYKKREIKGIINYLAFFVKNNLLVHYEMRAADLLFLQQTLHLDIPPADNTMKLLVSF